MSHAALSDHRQANPSGPISSNRSAAPYKSPLSERFRFKSQIHSVPASNIDRNVWVSSGLLRRKLAQSQPHVGIHRIARNNHRVSTAALMAVEYAVFKPRRSGLRFRKRHAWIVTLWAALPINAGKVGCRWGLEFGHSAIPVRRERYRALCRREMPFAGGDDLSCTPWLGATVNFAHTGKNRLPGDVVADLARPISPSGSCCRSRTRRIRKCAAQCWDPLVRSGSTSLARRMSGTAARWFETGYSLAAEA